MENFQYLKDNEQKTVIEIVKDIKEKQNIKTNFLMFLESKQKKNKQSFLN